MASRSRRGSAFMGLEWSGGSGEFWRCQFLFGLVSFGGQGLTRRCQLRQGGSGEAVRGASGCGLEGSGGCGWFACCELRHVRARLGGQGVFGSGSIRLDMVRRFWLVMFASGKVCLV